MALRCPVCRAAVEQGPACRRCKADLSMLLTIEQQRSGRLAAAWRAVRDGRWQDAVTEAGAAAALRGGPDTLAVRAVGHLMLGDFEAAWHAYRAAVNLHG